MPADSLKKIKSYFQEENLAIEEICDLDSTNVGPAIWEELAKKCRENEEKYAGILITHGTDTLAYTAAALTFMLPYITIPVVLTGSQRPLEAKDSDAPANLSDAAAVARSGYSGVFIVFGGRILCGDDARKVHTDEPDAFRNIKREQAGTVKSKKICWSKEEETKQKERTERIKRINEKEQSKLNSLSTVAKSQILLNCAAPSVRLIKLIPGFQPGWLTALGKTSPPVQGLVIEGFGLGGLPNKEPDLLKPLKALIEKGVIVILTTQVERGTSDLSVYEVGKLAKEAGALNIPHLTPEAAAVKLMVALGKTDSKERIRRYLETIEPSYIQDEEKSSAK